MKRLIGTVLAILAIAFSPAAFAQQRHKSHSTYCYQHPGEAGGCENTRPETGRVGGALIPNGYQRNLLPSDMVYVDRTKPPSPCDENGSRISPSQGYCRDIVSQSSGQHFVLRLSRGGDAAFIVHNGKLVKYAAFNGGTDSSAVAYLSDEARQYGEQHGYRYDQRSNTMVAVNAPVETPRVIDCKSSRLNIGDRLACTKGTANQGVVAAKDPTPTQSATTDCNTISNFLLKAKCLADQVAQKK